MERPEPPIGSTVDGRATAGTGSTSAVSPAVLVAIGVTVLAWASAFIVIRGVGPYFGGGELALGRLLVGTALLALTLLRSRWVRMSGREWMLVLVFGVAWFGAYNVALNIAEQTLDAGTTAMIVGIGPILIALGGAAFLAEGISRWFAIGASVAFFGVILIGVGTGAAGFHNIPGLLWALLAAVTYAIGVLCQKRVLRRIPAAQVTWLGVAIGAVTCLPFTAGLIEQVAAAPVEAVLGMIYLGAIPTSLAFTTWGFALTRMPAGQLGVTTYIVPALTVLLGWLLLREVPTALAIVGGAVCLTGVAVSRIRSRRPAAPAVPAPAQNLSQ
jgi:drug/metabolite transporter (DMT)-like permease